MREKEDERRKDMKALLISGNSVRQESYDSASGDAKKRATQLRKLGYKVTVSALGSQVTPIGIIGISMVTIYNPDDNVPKVEEIRFSY